MIKIYTIFGLFQALKWYAQVVYDFIQQRVYENLNCISLILLVFLRIMHVYYDFTCSFPYYSIAHTKKNRDTYFKGNFIYFVAQIMICSKNMIYLIYLSLLKKTGELTNWNCT